MVITTKVKAALAAGLLVVSCGLSFGAAWSYQGASWQASEQALRATHAEALQAQSARALTDYKRMETLKDEAVKEHALLAAQNAVDSAAAKRSADGLRKQLDRVPSLIATATESALREYATASSELLGNCTAEYQRMADKAQGHAADVQLLLGAWPRNEQP